MITRAKPPAAYLQSDAPLPAQGKEGSNSYKLLPPPYAGQPTPQTQSQNHLW